MIKGKYLTTVIFIVFTLFVSCKIETDWIEFRGNMGQGATENTLSVPLAVKWKLKLQESEERATSFNPPVIIGNTIYFGSTDGNFYALDIESGYMNWVFKTSGQINSIPYGDEENVYFGSNDGYVYAVSQKEGTEQWRFPANSTIQSIVTKYNGMIAFTSDAIYNYPGATYFLSEDGIEQHKIPNPVWSYHTFQIYDDYMYFAPGPMDIPHSFGVYNMISNSYEWIIETWTIGASWYSFPAVKDKFLYYSTCERSGTVFILKYFAVDRITGSTVWEYTTESDFGQNVYEPANVLLRRNIESLDYLAPAIWNNLVIYTSGDTIVRAFHLNSENYFGDIAWENKFEYITSSAPTVAGDRIYFGLRGDDFPEGDPPKLICLSAHNGNELWQIDLEGAVLSAPVISGKWIVFGTDENYFYVLEEVY